MQGIFISYRREDSAGHSGRIFDHLTKHFGKDRVFMDISAIEPGVDFVESIDRAVGSCAVLLVVIGREWLTLKDNSGRRRIDNPDDHLRIEIATALKRNIRVIPLLVQDAVMPVATELPEDIAMLARRQAHELSDQRWDFDTDELIKTLEKIVGRSAPQEAPTGEKAAGQYIPPERSPEPVQAAPPKSTKRFFTAKKLILTIAAVVLLVAGVSIYDYYDSYSTYDSYYVPPQPAAPTPPVRPPVQPRLSITGVWSGSDGYMYELHQNGNVISLLGRDMYQVPVIRGEGVIQGQQIAIRYVSADNTGGIATLYISEDGNVLQGSYVNQVTGLSGNIVLSRSR